MNQLLIVPIDDGDNAEKVEEKFRQGDYVKVVNGRFSNFYAIVTDRLEDGDVNIRYFKEKGGKPHGKYYVVTVSKNEEDTRAPQDKMWKGLSMVI